MVDTDEPIDLEDEHEALDQRSRVGTSFVTGVAVGALLGAGLALFFTSERGKRTSQRIREEWDDLKDDTRRGLARRRRDLSKRATRLAREVRNTVQDTVQDVRDRL